MDKASREIAVRAHEAFSAEVSPLYHDLRSQLLASADIVSLRGEHEEGLDNAAVVKRFVPALPRASDGKFKNADPSMVLLQQASTVEYKKTPCYIVGVNHRESALIGASVLPEGSKQAASSLIMFSAVVDRCSSERMRTLQKFIATEYGLKRIKSKVTSEIDELLRSLEVRTNSLYNSLNVNSTTIEAMFDNSSGLFEASPTTNLTRIQGLSSIYWGFKGQEVNYLSDQEMADYNVSDYLSNLATAFGKNDELTSILQK